MQHKKDTVLCECC